MKYAILCALCIGIVAVFLASEKKEKYVLSVFLKGAASLCFVLIGLWASKAAGGDRVAHYVMIGLILGCIADVLLNLRFVFKKLGTPVFLVGILVFLSGHILYLCALIPRCPSLWVFLVIGAVLTFLTIKWIFTKITAKKAFKIFGVFYIGAIMIMNCVAVGALLANPGAHSIVYLIGALLFLVSDVVLILNTFGGSTKFSLRIVNISLYYLGQLMIAMSLLLL